MKKSILSTSTCSVCQKSVTSNYCGDCGQKISVGTTTLYSLFLDFFSNLFNVEKSGFATIYSLIKNPKLIVENYYLGYRNYYASPGKIFLYSLAAIALHITFVDKTLLGMSLDIEEVSVQYAFWLFFFPLATLTSFFSFIGLKRRFVYHIISIVYLAGALLVVTLILFDTIQLVTGKDLSTWPLLFLLLLTFVLNAKAVLNKSSILKITLFTLIQLLIFVALATLMVLFLQGMMELTD